MWILLGYFVYQFLNVSLPKIGLFFLIFPSWFMLCPLLPTLNLFLQFYYGFLLPAGFFPSYILVNCDVACGIASFLSRLHPSHSVP